MSCYKVEKISHFISLLFLSKPNSVLYKRCTQSVGNIIEVDISFVNSEGMLLYKSHWKKKLPKFKYWTKSVDFHCIPQLGVFSVLFEFYSRIDRHFARLIYAMGSLWEFAAKLAKICQIKSGHCQLLNSDRKLTENGKGITWDSRLL